METFDVWVQSFTGDADPVPELMRIFGIDEHTARDLCETAPRRVKRGVPRAHADSIANALQSIGAKVEVRATQGAHTSASRAKISLTHLAPLEEKTSGLELAFEPSKATRPAARAPLPTPAPVQQPAPVASSAPSWTPWLMRLGTGLVIAFIGMGVRMAFRAARAPSEADQVTMEAQETAASVASGVPLNSFLARRGASLGVDTDRNRALTVELMRLGATRLLVTDVIPMGNHEVATRLIVELPASQTVRRAIAQAIARFYAHGERVEPGDVEMPSPSDASVFVDFE
jgi:hypothetical protein